MKNDTNFSKHHLLIEDLFSKEYIVKVAISTIANN